MNKTWQVYFQKTDVHPLGEVMCKTSGGEVSSRRYSNSWDFSGVQAVAVGKKAIVPFTKTNPIYKKAIQDTLAGLYNFYKDKNMQAPTSSQLNAWRLGLQHASDALGSTEWHNIDTPQGYRSFKSKLKKASLGKGTIELNVTVALNRLLDIGAINRIIDGSELKALSNAKIREQHIAIPISMYQKLISHAISTVEMGHSKRKEIARVAQEVKDIIAMVESGKHITCARSNIPLVMSRLAVNKRITKGCRSLIKHDIPGLDVGQFVTWLGRMQSSCLIVTLAFSGARIGEAVSFNQESYTSIKADSGRDIPVLQGETSKGNDGKPKKETWQTHPITKDALELAYELTGSLRGDYKVDIESKLESGEYTVDHYRNALKDVNSAFIPCSNSDQNTSYCISGVGLKLSNLMRTLGIKATENDVEEFNLLNPSREGQLKVGGFLPKLTPHDFRRTFAVFFKRYGFGGSSAIKFQYKHENINMSDYYSNNSELMTMHDVLLDSQLFKLLEEEGVRLGVDIYDDIYNVTKHLSGREGERIAKDKFDKVKAGHEVFMSRGEIECLVRNGSFAVVQLPTGGYCTNGECNRICGTELFIGEKKECPSKVHTDKTAKVLARQRNRLIKKFRGLNSMDSLWASVLVGIKQKIKEIEITLVKHEVKHEVFEDKVRGLIDVKS